MTSILSCFIEIFEVMHRMTALNMPSRSTLLQKGVKILPWGSHTARVEHAHNPAFKTSRSDLLSSSQKIREKTFSDMSSTLLKWWNNDTWLSHILKIHLHFYNILLKISFHNPPSAMPLCSKLSYVKKSWWMTKFMHICADWSVTFNIFVASSRKYLSGHVIFSLDFICPSKKTHWICKIFISGYGFSH